jgi:hypothetical protein
MFSDNATTFSTMLILMAGAGTCVMFNYFSPEVSQQRRRRKNHGRVVVKARRPVVSLFCRAPKA